MRKLIDMRLLVIGLILFSMCAAFSVKPDYYDIKDTGAQSLSPLDVGIRIDCDTKVLTADVRSNVTKEPLGDAKLFLFYTQYEYQLIGSGKTNGNGTGTINVIGNKDYLTRLFILRTDREGYQSREIEFSFRKCFEAPPKPEANATPPANTSQNTTAPVNQTPPKPPANQTLPQNTSSPGNLSGNGTVQETGNPEPVTQPPRQSPCPIGLALFSLLLTRLKI